MPNAQNSKHISESCKGIVFEGQEVWLRKNERNEWELPGGKREVGEEPEETVARELLEELGFEVVVNQLIDTTTYYPLTQWEEGGVLVKSYSCDLIEKIGEFELWGEGGKAEFDKFSIEAAKALPMPQFYFDAIMKAAKMNPR